MFESLLLAANINRKDFGIKSYSFVKFFFLIKA